MKEQQISEVTVSEEQEYIQVEGARENNLRNIHVNIPREQLVVITGISGSGKSSLAFDTIYAEGQRRYIETFSAYARQFLGGMERPDVDKITGLSPVISIEQKTISRNPRSTVGTITEVYDFMRLIYARASEAFSYNTGEKMVRYTDEQITELIIDQMDGEKLLLLAPLVKGRKGHYRELFENIMKQGYVRARVDGELVELEPGYRIDRYKIHDIEAVVDRVKVDKGDKQRILKSVQNALRMGKGRMMVMPHDGGEIRHFSRFLMCPTTGIAYAEPEPNLFSFNSPYGACPKCNGLGQISEVNPEKIIPDPKKSIKQGGIAPLGEMKGSWAFTQVEAVLEHFGHTVKTPLADLEEEVINTLLYGSELRFTITPKNGTKPYNIQYEGVIALVERAAQESSNAGLKRWANSFMNKKQCPTCKGTRLKKESLYFKIHDRDIASLANEDIVELAKWFEELDQHLNERQKVILKEPLKEIRARLGFLLDVGLDYLTLDRSARTLSGGEAQRIRLATQIGSKLVGVLYILDEPSIGLHQRDNQRLIQSLKALRDAGNSVIVVEHDKDMMLESDYLIDIGPGAGVHGGTIVAQGSPQEHVAEGSTTSKYLKGELEIAVPPTRRKGNRKKLTLTGASGHNLKNVKLSLPLGTLVCVTGVSGSGKSSLINQTLYPILHNHFYEETKRPLDYKKITGLQHLDKVSEIDQSPIGRTPRSNPATYTGIFSEIRNLFTKLPEAQVRGYKPGRFSFNVAGGRCETCKGAGLRTIEMNFLPDVYVQCETCMGKRYNRETLEVRYRGKSIADVLDMTIEEAVEFFENIPKIRRMAQTLKDVGLGYITLGQQSTTLSGGEAQRVKLASELAKRSTGSTFYILDEPTTGLHFEDVRMLISVLNRLVDQGNTVLVIEHNMDVIKVADHIVDIGPEGGNGGGQVIAQGTPEEIIKVDESYTGKFLKVEL
ncbi:excinuclease ABC subunit UvrA [Sanyastnella coralliicola]|uniref:excinuclease ABC subunit UvrA n=1 Tax=Sanyastnella coralliicola TaxID=3069118 RepID=UPI0027B91E36|nr:excinuclease ABC subunit UvrA [Longitalea sp. SCSIO 12813]